MQRVARPRMPNVVSSSLAELVVGGGELSLISQGISSMEQVRLRESLRAQARGVAWCCPLLACVERAGCAAP